MYEKGIENERKKDNYMDTSYVTASVYASACGWVKAGFG